MSISASVPAMLQKDPHLLQRLLAKADTSDAAPRISLASAEVEPQQPLGRKVLVPADSLGHFKASFRINGVAVDAMIDTGATLVAVNTSTARRAGDSLARLRRPTDLWRRGVAAADRRLTSCCRIA